MFGGSEHCLATHPGDVSVALAVLEAVVHAQTADGPVTIPIGDFHRLPADSPQHDTTLPPGAVITAVELPPPTAGSASTYRKARDRASYAFALVSVAAVLVVQDGILTDVRIALGGVAAKPWRATLAEAALLGRPATAASFGAAADAELAQATPTGQNAFKLPARVDLDSGEVRVPRMLGVFAVGRIINPRTARSQLLGGMVMGLSMALHESGTLDIGYGDYANSSLTDYHVATHADVVDVQAEWVEEHDDQLNAIGTKGIGEIGIVGSPAAVLNAVWHATGVRVRELPITPDRLLGGLPERQDVL